LINLKKQTLIKKPSNKKIIEVLEKTGGLLKPAATKLGITRQTIYEWIEREPELKEALATIRESMVDMSEGALYKQISEGNTAAILFLLKTQGKHRGYIERSESDITSGGKTIRITLPTPDEPADNA